MLVLACAAGGRLVGQTLVIIIGGIDLSIPFVIGFANVVAAQLYGDGMNFVLVCAIVARAGARHRRGRTARSRPASASIR